MRALLFFLVVGVLTASHFWATVEAAVVEHEWEDGSACLSRGVCKRAVGFAGLPNGSSNLRREMTTADSAIATHWNSTLLPLSFAAQHLFAAAPKNKLSPADTFVLWHGEGFGQANNFAIVKEKAGLVLTGVDVELEIRLTDDDLLVEDSGLVLGAEGGEGATHGSFEAQRDDCTDEFTVVDHKLGELVGRGCAVFRLVTKSTGKARWFASSAATFHRIQQGSSASVWSPATSTDGSAFELHWSLTSAHSRVFNYYHPEGFSERLWAGLTSDQKQVLVTCAMQNKGGVASWKGSHWFPECVKAFKGLLSSKQALDSKVLAPLLRWPHSPEAAAAMGRPGFGWSSWRLCRASSHFCVHPDDVGIVPVSCPSTTENDKDATVALEEDHLAAVNDYYGLGQQMHVGSATGGRSSFRLVDILPSRLAPADGFPRNFKIASERGTTSLEQLGRSVRCVAALLNMSNPRNFAIDVEVQPALLSPKITEALAATTFLLNDLSVLGLYGRYAKPLPSLDAASVVSRGTLRSALQQIGDGLLLPSPALDVGVWRVQPSQRHRDRLNFGARSTFNTSGTGLLAWLRSSDPSHDDLDLLLNQTGLFNSLLEDHQRLSLDTSIKLVPNGLDPVLTLGSVLTAMSKARTIRSCSNQDACLTLPGGLQLPGESTWSNSTLYRLLRAAIFHKAGSHINTVPVQPTTALARTLGLVVNVAWHDFSQQLDVRARFTLAKLARATRRSFWRVFTTSHQRAATPVEEVTLADAQFFDRVGAAVAAGDRAELIRLQATLDELETTKDIDSFEKERVEEPSVQSWAWYWPKIGRLFFEFVGQPQINDHLSHF